MEILVTGGAGFIGHHLIKRLLNDGNSVVCIDNLLTGNIHNILEFKKNENFKFIEKDIIYLKYLNFNINFDQIYNLACPASPKKYQENPIHTIKTNTIGIINILDLAVHHNARIFQASTSEIYGDPMIHPQTEDYFGNVNTIGVRSCYDEGKRIAETLFSDYHRVYGTDIRIARIFNTYGEYMQPDDGRIITNFIYQSLNKKPLKIYGDGKQTRSLCYINDLIEGLISLMGKEGAQFHKPYNLGNPEEIIVIDIAKKVAELTNNNLEFIFLELPEDDPIRRKPNIEKAQKDLNWMPNITLENGLLRVISFLK